MKKVALYAVIAVFSSFLLVGCSDKPISENQLKTDSYNGVREAAWFYVKNNGWDQTAKENWQSATVEEVVVNNHYSLVDESYRGKEALAVSFEEKENVVIAPPVILVDIKTNEVIGFMPSE